MAAERETTGQETTAQAMAGRETGERLTRSLTATREQLEAVFVNCHDIVFHTLQREEREALYVYCTTLTSSTGDQLAHLLRYNFAGDPPFDGQTEPEQEEEAGDREERDAPLAFTCLETLGDVCHAVLNGSIVVLFDGQDIAYGCLLKPIPGRQVTEPVNEPAVHGPREGTTEDLSVNLGMLRRRIRNPQFKVEYLPLRGNTNTRIAFGYLEQAVNPDVLAEYRRRTADIAAYDVLETSYVGDWIQESDLTPFPQARYTERTDTAAAALLDGRIVTLVENSPMIMISPALFVDFMGTAEDYYVRTVFASLIRLLRLLAFGIALTLPSIYIALSTFHPELIPSVLMYAIVDSREGIPFSALVEAFIMEIAFELLREAGIRLPRPVGSAVSIVGALVIGQAAIMAKIASPIMVIVVALTGIASFAIPHYDIAISLRILRFPFMIAAGMLGGYGLMLACLLTLLHLTSLHSLGQPYLSSIAPFNIKDMRDVVIRAPLSRFLQSPRSDRLRHRAKHRHS